MWISVIAVGDGGKRNTFIANVAMSMGWPSMLVTLDANLKIEQELDTESYWPVVLDIREKMAAAMWGWGRSDLILGRSFAVFCCNFLSESIGLCFGFWRWPENGL